MDKNNKVNKILSIAKGITYEDRYGRNFTVSDGTLTLEKETETPNNPEGVSFVMRHDDTPVNEFVSKVNSPKFKPSEAYMKRLEIQYTDHFRTKYIVGLVDDTSTELIQFTIDKRGKQTFASREEDVDVPEWCKYSNNQLIK
jgi:hypothetical protein